MPVAGLTELLDPEIELLLQLMNERKIHPMGVKTLLASDVTCTIYGIEAAAASRTAFTTQFSQKRFSDTPNLPVVERTEQAETSIGELFVKVTQLVQSMNQVRRVASGGGLRLVTESPSVAQQAVSLAQDDVNASLAALLAVNETLVAQADTRVFLKSGSTPRRFTYNCPRAMPRPSDRRSTARTSSDGTCAAWTTSTRPAPG